MARLTEADRKKLKPSQFGLPEERKYPMPDWQHAVNAKARARQQLREGKISRAEYERIIMRANQKIVRG